MNDDEGKVVPLREIGQAIDEAASTPDPTGSDTPATPPKKKAARKKSAGSSGGDDGPGIRWAPPPGPEHFDLPFSCPVVPLGSRDGSYYFLTPRREYVRRAGRELNAAGIRTLFGQHMHWLYEWHPAYDKDGFVVGFKANPIAEQLIVACDNQPVWEPGDRLRGTGCWKDDDGHLVVHCGRTIIHNGERTNPGKIGEHVYPAAPPWIDPSDANDRDGRDTASKLYGLLGTWNWQRNCDARLLLGFIMASLVGGAMKVRPLVWVDGEAGDGKSSLTGVQEGIIPALHGGNILAPSDTTAAGIYQQVGNSSRLVAVDEIENKAGNKKTEGVIELARAAYSGGSITRGGDGHQGVQFRAQFSLMFSSINIPPLKNQDLSRMAILRLGKLQETGGIDISRSELREWGASLLHLWITEWDRWPAYLESWRKFFIGLGHDARGADQFGTLMAAADFALGEDISTMSDKLEIAGLMAPEFLTETASKSSDALTCLEYLLSRRLNIYRQNSQATVSEWVEAAAADPGTNQLQSEPNMANRELARYGLMVVAKWRDGSQMKLSPKHKANPRSIEEVLLAVATQGDGILTLYDGSDWQGLPGAYNPWVTALTRLPGAERANKNLRFGGHAGKSILVPLHLVLAPDDDYQSGDQPDTFTETP